MKVVSVSSINFCGKIIDAHAHIGRHEGQIYKKEDLDIFIKEPLPNNDTVEKFIISDLDILHSLSDEYKGNKELLALLNDKSKYVLIASCSPKDGNVEKIERLFKEHPYEFVGLKFHPTIQNLETTNIKYKPYMEYAEKNKIPCLFHTDVLTDGEGKLVKELSKSDPESVYNLAKSYKNVPIVMAHMGAGWNEAQDKAINVLVKSIKNGDANLYADISWVDIDAPIKNGDIHHPKNHIIKAIKALKGIGDETWKYGDQSFRLMFGTDAPLGRFKDSKEPIKDYTNFIEDIKYAIRQDADLKGDAEKIIDDIFYNNAKKLYINTSKIKAVKTLKNLLEFSETEKQSFKVKLAACLLIIAAGAISCFNNFKTSFNDAHK